MGVSMAYWRLAGAVCREIFSTRLEQAQFAVAIVAAADLAPGGYIEVTLIGIAVLCTDFVALKHCLRDVDLIERSFASRICAADFARCAIFSQNFHGCLLLFRFATASRAGRAARF